jgi:hypothetical protein
MIDTDKYEETDHPELIEFEGETLGDTLTNLLAEVQRLRSTLDKVMEYAKNQMDADDFCAVRDIVAGTYVEDDEE